MRTSNQTNKTMRKASPNKKRGIPSRSLSHEEIAYTAYSLWQKRGGNERDNWFEAEELLKQKPS